MLSHTTTKQFVHMMVDSDPGAHGKHAYQGRRISLDLGGVENDQQPAASPAPPAAAAPTGQNVSA